MKGIRFGQYHSWDDFGLVLSKKEMGAPSVKTKTIDIEGADGVLDLTDFFGEPKYENVQHKFEFTLLSTQAEFLSIFSRLKNFIHGKKVRIILDDDPTYFYIGRCFVSSFTSANGVGTVTVECDCEPYKYAIAKTVVTQAVNGTEIITLTNGRKRAVPEVTIQTETSLNIVYQAVNVWDLGAGSYTLPELELTEGENTVTVTGTGTITFEWQGAML